MRSRRDNISPDFYGEQFEFLVNELTDFAIFTVDRKNRIQTWNAGVQRLLHYRRNEFVGRSGRIIFTPEDRKKKAEEQEMRTAAREGRAADERWHVRKNGERFWGSGIMSSLRGPSGEIVGFVKIMRDDTARRRAEEQLKQLNDTLEQRVQSRTADLMKQQDQLRTLALELSRAEQNVRQRIAGELHDDVAQLLAVCSYPMAAARVVSRDPEARKQIDLARKGLDQAIDNVRRIMSGLSPVSIDERNLRGVIDWAVDTTREYGLDVRVDDDGRTKPLSREVLVLIGNIVRELLVNVSKHARTKTASVSLRRIGPSAVISVRDDGKGFKLAPRRIIGPRSGFGLYSVRERLQLMNGQMDLRSKPGKGTGVTLTVPLQKAARKKRAKRTSRK